MFPVKEVRKGVERTQIVFDESNEAPSLLKHDFSIILTQLGDCVCTQTEVSRPREVHKPRDCAEAGP